MNKILAIITVAITCSIFSVSANAYARWSGYQQITTQNGQTGVVCGYWANGSEIRIFFPDAILLPK